jgi:branched-chain amino acid transport system ATP-binding protein
MSIALRLDGVSAGYGGVRVLHGIDLAVPTGKAVALLGANGAGKTTLLKAAAGLIRPTAGEVWLGGQRITRLPEHGRVRLGIDLIPEGRGIFRQLSVRDNLAMFAGMRPLDEAIDKVVSVFPILGERLAQEAATLSGGQQQMLAISRALVTDARVVLADELSLGLAPVVVDEIFDVFKIFLEQGRSLLVVEQYVSRVLSLADYVYILHKGRVAFVGEPEQCEHEQVFARYMGSVA